MASLPMYRSLLWQALRNLGLMEGITKDSCPEAYARAESVAAQLGFDDPQELERTISNLPGEVSREIDWRKEDPLRSGSDGKKKGSHSSSHHQPGRTGSKWSKWLKRHHARMEHRRQEHGRSGIVTEWDLVFDL